MKRRTLHDAKGLGAMRHARKTRFETAGFVLAPGVASKEACESIADRIQPAAASAGTRCLLREPWCAALAGRLRAHPALRGLIPDRHVAVQCTYFEKSPRRNWLVGIHQDLSVPVAARTRSAELSGWSEKEGQLFVLAPTPLLEQLVAVRLHLDDCTAEDGPLKVVAGSHGKGRLTDEQSAALRAATREIACVAARGAALVMRPLLLHSSSKSTGAGRRRVLHFVFGPPSPGHGLHWPSAV